MFYILTSSADTYITNKIIDNSFKAEDTNVGRAATLDLFKLYDESVYISGSTRITSSVDEISRLLVKFNYDTLVTLASSSLDFTHSSFKAKLELTEIETGAPVPRNFWVVAHPLAQAFDEGSGRDVNRFLDVDAANFLTASYSSSGSPVLWNISGSGRPGPVGSGGIDYITTGTLGSTKVDYGAPQYFSDGPGKISVDVTKVLSSSLAGDLPNYGFRISFSGSYETDTKTRFAKRFAARHVRNKLLAPRILVTWDNTIKDSHKSFVFNSSASLFLKNTLGGTAKNIRSGTAETELTGQNCILLTLISGSGATATSIYVTGSQHTGSATGAGMTGVYSASFALDRFNSTFFKTLKSRDDLKLTEIWSSIDRTIGYLTSSITVKKYTVGSDNFVNRDLVFSALNVQPEYKQYSRAKIRVFIEDIDAGLKAKSYKLPRKLDTVVVDKVYYRIRDIETNTIVVPFDDTTNSTMLSVDSAGMYIDLMTAGLPLNRNYTIDLLVKDMGVSEVIELNNISFRITS
ncbi:hypothetical protein CMI47_02530 [Candidatus Pacearchaeota archaeon]|nr:hypothetical protein [Candidatus Pacearchaeota archaeon]|tara:strand:- start:8740 stop:10293 length:1554 start_codon:yes stop_codon:yes gene_type:complete